MWKKLWKSISPLQRNWRKATAEPFDSFKLRPGSMSAIQGLSREKLKKHGSLNLVNGNS